MNFDPRDFGLKKDYLYEILASTYSITENGKEIKPNTSCMGIRLTDDNQITISPYPSTYTYINLKDTSIITISFLDNIYLYALAALKEANSPIGLTEFPPKYYNFKNLESRAISMPYINEAWAILICEVESEFQKVKQNGLGDVMIPVFSLKVIYWEKLMDSFKTFNRAENLALETIILATRLKIAKGIENLDLFNNILEKIKYFRENIQRFGKNKNALKTIELVNNYIRNL